MCDVVEVSDVGFARSGGRVSGDRRSQTIDRGGGIVALVRKEWIYGAVLIVLGFLVGPGGVSIFV